MRTNILISFKNYLLGKIAKTLARCIRIETALGAVYAYTSHTRDLVIDGVTYQSLQGLQVSDVRFAESLVPDTFTLSTFLFEDLEDLVSAGFFDDARVEAFVVNYLDLGMGTIIENSGRIGDITRQDGIVQTEVRGLAQVLDTKVGRIFSASCDANLGDARCKFPLNPIQHTIVCDVAGSPDNTLTRSDLGSFINDGYTVGSTIIITGSSAGNNLTVGITVVAASVLTVDTTLFDESNVALQLLQLTDSWSRGIITDLSSDLKTVITDIVAPDGRFNQGRILFTSGNNNGVTNDVRFSVGGTLTTYLDVPLPLEIGDTIEVTVGCDKTGITCRDKFNNKINFRGFDFVPTNEDVFNNPQFNG